jgi:putative DNA primase/helicase
MNVIPLEARALSALGDTSVQLVRASVIPRRPIHWLWPGWLARGKLHLLAGAPGTGKTTLALTLAATISRGRSWPDGTTAAGGQVLIWSGEDDPADTLVPRLHAAGADLDRIFIVGDTWIEGESRAFDPAHDLAALESQAAALGNIALLIADPVVSAVTGDSHKNTEVRRALQPLVYLAARLNCAVLGITHFSKNTSGRDPTERVTGSVAFGALARLVLVTAQDKHGERVLARAKSNIGPDGGGFAYTLEQQCCDGMEASRIVWGDPLQGCARKLLGVAEDVGDSRRDNAAAWLSGMLEAGDVPVKTLKTEAAAAGLSWRTVERAKIELDISVIRIGGQTRGGGYWVWRWPVKTATIKAANPALPSGGLKESPPEQWVMDDFGIKAANLECGGLNQGQDHWEAEL